MEKLKQAFNSLATVQVDLKFGDKHANPMISYLLLILGAYKLLKLMNSSYSSILYPQLRRLFYAIFKDKNRLLSSNKDTISTTNKNKWVLIYGATNHIGQCAAKVFAKYGYSLILVDSNLEKLQKMREELGNIFPQLLNDGENNRIQIININFAIWKDSTSLEHKIREVITLDKDIPIFVNAISFLNPWQVCEDKLFHEVQFDQIFQYLNNTVLGYSVFLNFFCRLIVHFKRPSCLINLVKKEVRPYERTSFPMKVLRVLYFPLYYHKLMERMNILHYGVNQYINEVGQSSSYGYPMLRSYQISIDSREDKTYEVQRLESALSTLRY